MTETRSNIPDFKRNGEWVRSFTTVENGVKIQNSTRADVLYKSVKARCNPKGSNYRKSKFGFGDFQEFADWCQDQPGYMNKELNGRFWAIDKDWLSPYEPLYSEGTCLFVPVRVNALTVNHTTRSRDLPLGVSWYDRYGKYSSVCGRGNTLGYFDTPMSAHRAWQFAQVDRIRKAVEPEFCDKLKQAMETRALFIEDDIELGLETKYC